MIERGKTLFLALVLSFFIYGQAASSSHVHELEHHTHELEHRAYEHEHEAHEHENEESPFQTSCTFCVIAVSEDEACVGELSRFDDHILQNRTLTLSVDFRNEQILKRAIRLDKRMGPMPSDEHWDPVRAPPFQ
jgi:hypothetical protein